MSKLGDIQNMLTQLREDVDNVSKENMLEILNELLSYVVDLERETIQLLQSRAKKESGQSTINWESLRLDASPFKINPLHN